MIHNKNDLNLKILYISSYIIIKNNISSYINKISVVI